MAVNMNSIDLMPKPFDWIEIPNKGYSIAKYPITNAQYAKFIEVGGYHEKRWWTDSGWQERTTQNWAEPRFWQEEEWCSEQQPVVGVSWFEAMAFCLWLSQSADENITLPTEEQWQTAAQGDTDSIYPWGDEWDCTRCNNSHHPCKSRLTTPVTKYEGQGDSLNGVVDMAGNVWEWCLTLYEIEVNVTYSNLERHIIRGGSYYDHNLFNFRCDYRSQELANNWNDYIGFRIVCLSS